MKRHRSSDSLTPISPTAPHGEEKAMYGMAFSSILESMDEDDCGDELCSSSNTSKKRRLSIDQVRSLEKSFEIENKLDPERKVRLAQELGLQPRQVAVWFQNRRARWKTKQLERDYNALKASYEALRADYDSLRDDNQSLAVEIEELKGKLADDEEPSGSPEESDEKPFELVEDENPPLIYKDGLSDSDSSGVLNDDASPPYHHPVLPEAQTIFDSVTTNAFMDLKPGKGFGFFHQLLKEEEQDDTCTDWFSDEQPPTLSWCCPDSWNWADGGGDGNISKREGPF